jgi:hypothetical protein
VIPGTPPDAAHVDEVVKAVGPGTQRMPSAVCAGGSLAAWATCPAGVTITWSATGGTVTGPARAPPVARPPPAPRAPRKADVTDADDLGCVVTGLAWCRI